MIQWSLSSRMRIFYVIFGCTLKKKRGKRIRSYVNVPTTLINHPFATYPFGEVYAADYTITYGCERILHARLNAERHQQ